MNIHQKLLDAAVDNNLEMAQILIDIGADVNAYEGWALSYAIEDNDFKMVQLLIKNGADVNIRNGKSLCWSVKYNSLRMVQLLLENGADINYLTTKEIKKLKFKAFFKGDLELVKLLMEAK